MYSIGECAMIYGFLLLITAIGVLFLLQFGFFSKGFYNKYTLHAKATVKSTLGSHIGTPVITYAAMIDGKEEILTEQCNMAYRDITRYLTFNIMNNYSWIESH